MVDELERHLRNVELRLPRFARNDKTNSPHLCPLPRGERTERKCVRPPHPDPVRGSTSSPWQLTALSKSKGSPARGEGVCKEGDASPSLPRGPLRAPEGKDERERWSWGIGYCAERACFALRACNSLSSIRSVRSVPSMREIASSLFGLLAMTLFSNPSRSPFFKEGEGSLPE